MKIGIVGSRRRNTLRDRGFVFRIVEEARRRYGIDNVTIVSGGCRKGADKFAEEAADWFGLDKKIFPIDESTPIETKKEFVFRAFSRNRLIVEESDVVFALVHSDRTGGTENTVGHCIDLKIKCYLVDDAGNCIPIG